MQIEHLHAQGPVCFENVSLTLKYFRSQICLALQSMQWCAKCPDVLMLSLFFFF